MDNFKELKSAIARFNHACASATIPPIGAINIHVMTAQVNAEFDAYLASLKDEIKTVRDFCTKPTEQDIINNILEKKKLKLDS